jgi:ribose 5-phosphate isomerase RpiB
VHEDERGQILGGIGIGKALALSDEAEITCAEVTYPSLQLELDTTCDSQVVLVGTFRPGFGVRRGRFLG